MIEWTVQGKWGRETEWLGTIVYEGRPIYCHGLVYDQPRYLSIEYSISDLRDEPYVFNVGTEGYKTAKNCMRYKRKRDLFMTAGIKLLVEKYYDEQRLGKDFPNVQERANKFLISFLSPSQRRTWKAKGHFYEVGPMTGWIYRFIKDETGVDVMEKRGTRYYPAGYQTRDKSRNYYYNDPRPYMCLHHDDKWIPTADTTISQLLLIRSDEAQFLEKANWHRDVFAPQRSRAA